MAQCCIRQQNVASVAVSGTPGLYFYIKNSFMWAPRVEESIYTSVYVNYPCCKLPALQWIDESDFKIYIYVPKSDFPSKKISSAHSIQQWRSLLLSFKYNFKVSWCFEFIFWLFAIWSQGQSVFQVDVFCTNWLNIQNPLLLKDKERRV